MFKSVVTIPSTFRVPCLTVQSAAILALWSLLGTAQICVAQVAAPEVAATSPTTVPTRTIRQEAYLKATIDQRVRLSESLGEEGARAFAMAKNWKPILDGTAKGIAQGPDQVYCGTDGTVHVIEAKGGTSQLGHAYGHPQASSEWAVESAKRVSRSAKATTSEKEAAVAIFKAAANRKLQVHVIRTNHILGEPTAAVLQQTVQTSETAAKLAHSALSEVTKTSLHVADDVARLTDDAAKFVANNSNTVSGTLKTVAKASVVVGVAADGVLRVRDGFETERKFVAGEITVKEREVSHGKNAAGMAGGWTGAGAGALIAGSTIGPITPFTGPGAPFVEAAAVTAGGVAGYIGGEAAAGKVAEKAINVVHSTGTTIGEAAGSAWSATSNAARNTGKAARNAWSWATGW